MAFVYLFEEAKGLDKFALGGKGFGLAEMTSIGLPVPPGLVVTTDACRDILRKRDGSPRALQRDPVEAG